MNRVLEHEVDEVGVRLDKLVELLQIAQLATLFLIEDVEVVLARVQLHVLHLRRKVSFLIANLLISLL